MVKTQKRTAKPQAIGKEPSKVGRKSKVNDAMVTKFLIAIENGLTVKEAQQEASMPRGVYNRLHEKSQVFRDQIEVARMKLTIVARAGMANKIRQEDGSMIRWYLERKVPEEFSPSFGDGIPVGLPPGTVIVLPGSKPHPRIIPA